MLKNYYIVTKNVKTTLVFAKKPIYKPTNVQRFKGINAPIRGRYIKP